MNTYLEDSKRTLSNEYRFDDICPQRMANALLSIMQLGYTADLVKRNIFYGIPLDELDAGKGKQYQQLMQQADANVATKMAALASGEQFKMTEVFDFDQFHAIVGVMSEVGELAEAMLNQFVTGGEMDKVNTAEEIGDIFFYLAILLRKAETTPRDVEIQNIAKLRLRYPEKFTSELAVNRDTDAERKVLETNMGSVSNAMAATAEADKAVDAEKAE